LKRGHHRNDQTDCDQVTYRDGRERTEHPHAAAVL
jgi:hypothetical protein